ncbi:phosphoenolpyruvate mutase [Candidatus Peregrinibacteria bacterium]|nr:phosphoenolpyruvate mutase [Candidatus Peregrinibacteria bacterium]
MKKTTQFRELLHSHELEFLCEAHNALSARIAEEAGFKGIWASGLTISAALGVRDSNEASWTQILEVWEFMSDATKIPMMVDADTGYGNFNNVRRLVQKLEQRGVAAVCIEDKIFPKTNSFLENGQEDLADIDEFCGKIRAAKDAQSDPDFCVIARTEAFIAGLGLDEAMKRAEAYRLAGADAILIHSKISKPDEVLAFKKVWGERLPVVIVPTKYYTTPTDVFREAGFSMIIWANMILRSSIKAMKETAMQLKSEQSLHNIEDRIAPLSEVFRLQNAEELAEAEDRYLPVSEKNPVRAIILAASRGEEFGALTMTKPKAMLDIGGKPILFRQIDTLRDIGINDITVVRGFGKERITASGIRFINNDDFASTREVTSLSVAVDELPASSEKTLIVYGDLLYKKIIPSLLLEAKGDFVIAIDPNWKERGCRDRYTDYVSTKEPYRKTIFDKTVPVNALGPDLVQKDITGEWFGFLAISPNGFSILRTVLAELKDSKSFASMRMSDLFRELMSRGHTISAVYITGHWLDFDEIADLSAVGTF